MRLIFGIAFLIINLSLQAQFHPEVGYVGTHAIHQDSSIIRDWATACQVERGWQNILDTSLGKTSVGTESSALGMPSQNGVVSLGDGGKAVVTFAGKIYNGPGPDFVVFENAFSAVFLELAFVEVSDDGQSFYRFPAESLTDTLNQVGSFGALEATKINNFAGKYEAPYGVPFDLEELKDEVGLDVDHISHIRLIDVIGSLDDQVAQFDIHGRKVNDPFPTPYSSGGFDLDAVGAIHLRPTGLNEKLIKQIATYPNPTNGLINIQENLKGAEFKLINSVGKIIRCGILSDQLLDMSKEPAGVYFLQIVQDQSIYRSQIIKQ